MSNEMNFSHSYKETRKYRKYHQDHQLVDEVLCFFNEHNEKEYSLIELGKKQILTLKYYRNGELHLKKILVIVLVGNLDTIEDDSPKFKKSQLLIFLGSNMFFLESLSGEST